MRNRGVDRAQRERRQVWLHGFLAAAQTTAAPITAACLGLMMSSKATIYSWARGATVTTWLVACRIDVCVPTMYSPLVKSIVVMTDARGGTLERPPAGVPGPAPRAARNSAPV